MSTTVKVRWENGQPCTGVAVRLWLDREANEEKYTDSSGEVRFAHGPGYGTLYCEGKEVHKGNLPSSMAVTCRSSGYGMREEYFYAS